MTTRRGPVVTVSEKTTTLEASPDQLYDGARFPVIRLGGPRDGDEMGTAVVRGREVHCEIPAAGGGLAVLVLEIPDGAP